MADAIALVIVVVLLALLVRRHRRLFRRRRAANELGPAAQAELVALGRASGHAEALAEALATRAPRILRTFAIVLCATPSARTPT